MLEALRKIQEVSLSAPVQRLLAPLSSALGHLTAPLYTLKARFSRRLTFHQKYEAKSQAILSHCLTV